MSQDSDKHTVVVAVNQLINWLLLLFKMASKVKPPGRQLTDFADHKKVLRLELRDRLAKWRTTTYLQHAYLYSCHFAGAYE